MGCVRIFRKDWIIIIYMTKELRKWLPPVLNRDIYNINARVKNNRYLKLASKNSSLKGIHNGESCFILGSGGSLGDVDLRKLKNKNIISINNLFIIDGYKEIVSGVGAKYHLAAPLHPPNDRKVWSSWLRAMEETVPCRVKMLFGVNSYENNTHSLVSEQGLFLSHECYYFVPVYNRFSCTTHFTKRYIDLSGPVMGAGTASVYALMYAAYLGFSKVFLLGVDHDHIIKKTNGASMRVYTNAIHQNNERLSDNEELFRKQANTFTQYKIIRDSSNFTIINLSPVSLVDFFEYEQVKNIL